MGSFVFVLVVSLLIPSIMIVFGIVFSLFPPKEINSFYGYRTTMSMINKDTWKFAHLYCGKIRIVVGVVMLILSALTVLLLRESDDNITGIAGIIIIIIQTVILILSVIPVEMALRKNFDREGKRK